MTLEINLEIFILEQYQPDRGSVGRFMWNIAITINQFHSTKK